MKRTVAIVLTLLAGSGGAFWALHTRMGETRAETKELLAKISTSQTQAVTVLQIVSDKVDTLRDRMARVETRVEEHMKSDVIRR